MKIRELTLYTSRLREQTHFYSEVLGLKVQTRNSTKSTIKIGESLLTLIEDTVATPYHFAVNIPSNQVVEALDWLTTRVSILKDGNSEIQEFEVWNAKAIYFYDKDKNIVELIARKNLNYIGEEKFGAHQFLELSEIGLASDNIERQFTELNKIAKMTVFDGTLDRFCAIGNEQGLFICIDMNKKNWYPSDDAPFSSRFKIEFESGNETFRAEYKEGTINVTAY